MKKTLLLLLAFLLVFLLAGCGHEHIWKDATCTEPKTCEGCGATEGEPLGHKWKDATCTEPRICTRCGEAEGEPLGHEWKDATCTEPKTCLRCGATEGEPADHVMVGADYWQGDHCAACGKVFSEPLQPDFEKYGLDAYVHDIGTGETFTYTTCGYDGQQSLLKYDAVANVQAHWIHLLDENNEPTALENWPDRSGTGVGLYAEEPLMDIIRKVEALEKSGYEWSGVFLSVIYTKYPHGYTTASCFENYYDVVGHDRSEELIDTDESTYWVQKYTVHTQDGDKPMYMITYEGRAGLYGKGWVYSETYYYAPKGYDGIVEGVFDKETMGQEGVWAEGTYIFDYINENMLLFRLK